MYHKIQGLASLVVNNLNKTQKGVVLCDIRAKWAEIVGHDDIVQRGVRPVSTRLLNETELTLVLACSHGALAVYVAGSKRRLMAKIFEISGHSVSDIACVVNTKYFTGESSVL